MGGRAHGTWAKLYAGVWDHPKTATLARALEAIGVPPRWSSEVAVGQLHRLACRLADTTADGRIGHLAPQEFCKVVGWTDYRKADSVLAAWMSSGFIDNPGTHDAKLHGFHEMFSQLVKKREDSKRRREEAAREKRGSTRGATVEPRGNHGGSPRVRVESESESEQCSLPTVESTPPPPVADRAEAFADLWAEICPHLPQLRRPLSKPVRAKLEAALKREAGRDWRATFEDVADSDFLSGRKAGEDPFEAAMTWAIGPENLAKIDAGQYRNKTGTARPSRTALLAQQAQDLYERTRHGTPPDEVAQLEA